MKFSTFALVGLVPQLSLATNLRESASRIRNFADKDSVGSFNGEYARFFKMVAENPVLTLEDLMDSQQALETELDVEQAEIKAFMAAIQRSEIINLSMDISNAPSDSKSPSASDNPSVSPTVSSMPTMKVGDPTAAPSSFPSAIPTTTPSNSPSTTAPTTEPPTMVPTFAGCGFSAESRVQAILSILDAVADPVLIRDGTSSQGLATQWLIEDDEFRICPDDDKLIQRWSMAVMYFSTGGPDWFQCSGDEAATDICGAEDPFVGKQRFLSGVSECDWAGISCITGCVSEVEFESNNLVGTIPTEMGLLTDLAVWGMERGGLTGPIPTEIGILTNLIFLDLDFNALTGTLSSELLSLSTLTQLDLNNNQFTGSINGIGVYPAMEFLQLHDNGFTGTVPAAVGGFSGLVAFTLYETSISGVMPASVCELLETDVNGGVLRSLIADCVEPNPNVICPCCTECRAN